VISGSDQQQLEAVLEHLRRARGFDFTGYKRSTLRRRVAKRMAEVGVARFADYLDHLEVHPEEFPHLLDSLLINVTGFFRDPPAWGYLVGQVIPQIVASKRPGDPIRVWSAGCASGEEAFTLAIVLAEAIGPEAFRQRVKVYATDVDEAALAQARLGSYTAKDTEDLPAPLREKYFDTVLDRYVFDPDLRRNVIFGRHDLVQDAPISRLDLLVCRNTLMYFNADIQTRILLAFRFALRDNGFLFLGKAEMLLTHTDTFAPVEIRHRIFRPLLPATPHQFWPPPNNNDDAGNLWEKRLGARELALEAQPVATIVVESGGNLIFANERARGLFRLTVQDMGRPWHELEFSYRPLELRSRVEQAYAERRTLRVADVERVLPNGDHQYLDIEISPLRDTTGNLVGVSLSFADVTPLHGLRVEHERTTHELQTAYEELQSTNEELETANEELQSTNEELETANEELQSTNEEMETMNEELQSTNEELETVNRELRDRTEELGGSNRFLSSILGGLEAGVIVVDRRLLVTVWNHRSEELWGLRSDEVVGRPLVTLDMGLPRDPLTSLIQQSLDGEASRRVVVAAVNRRGARIECRVSSTPLLGADRAVMGAIVLVQDQEVRP
jgi:two-component system, chemotaxis family, CheB/CheR fusion protein